MNKTVLVPLATGFEEIEAVTIIDILRRAELKVITASLDENLDVLGAHNINIKADTDINSIEIDTLDMIVLPGGWGGTKLLASNKKVQDILKEMDKKDKNIGAICAAPYALNSAGVLKHNYTCYPSVEQEIRLDGYNNSKKVIEDDNIITSQGPATAMIFALEIVKKLVGIEKYQELKSGMLVEN